MAGWRLGLRVMGLLALGVSAARAQAPPSVITMPDWAALPTAADLAKAYPPEALKQGLGGKATIACVTTKDGLLNDCQVVEEDPQGMGFGDAALQLGALFKMRPMTKDGHPIDGGKVRIPIRFVAPPPAPAAAAPQAASIVTTPDWIRKPTGYDVARFYPPLAEQRHLNGGAVIGCSVAADGALIACRVLDEKPVGMGFGEAALKLGSLFRMRPLSKDSHPVEGGTVRIPIIFRQW